MPERGEPHLREGPRAENAAHGWMLAGDDPSPAGARRELSSAQFERALCELIDVESRRIVDSTPYARHLADASQRLDLSYYTRHRIETIHRIRGTARTDSLALAELLEIDYDLARLWASYTVEELGHDRLYLTDLAALGIDEPSVLATEPFPATHALLAYLEQRGVLASVAYSLFTEWNSDQIAMAVVERAVRDLPPGTTTGARHHVGIDEAEDHLPMIFEIADGLCHSDDDRRELTDHIFAIGQMVADSFRQLYDATIIPMRELDAAPPDAWSAAAAGSEHLNVAYLTSMRWVDAQDGRGVAEHLARASTDPTWEGPGINLVALVVDDDPDETDAAWFEGDLWPRSLQVTIEMREGLSVAATLDEITIRADSTAFRSVPTGEAREAARAAFERSLVDRLRERAVDLVLVDSYLCRIGPVLRAAFAGRVVNLHPAVTDPDDAARLPGRHPIRDTFTRAALGLVFVDDKPAEHHPVGATTTLEFDGRRRRAVHVAPLRECATTVHHVSEEIDGGPIVCCVRSTFDREQVSIPAIRALQHELREQAIVEAFRSLAEVSVARRTHAVPG